MNDIEKSLRPQMEGGVYEHVWFTNMEDTFFCAKDYYTVKNGVVLLINDGVEQKSGDTLLDLKSSTRFVGRYSSDKVYKGKRATMKQSQIKKALKL
jgi:hypothetical protein